MVIYLAKIIIQHGLIITIDKNRTILKDGAIAIDGDRIVAVDKTEKVKQIFEAEEVIDAKGKIVLPGLICGHSHMYVTLTRGMPASWPATFIEVLEKVWWPLIEDQLTKEDIYTSSLFSASMMLKNGTTCICDIIEAPHAIPNALQYADRALQKAGMRATLSFESTERISEENGKLGISENLNFIKNSKKDSLTRGMFCVHTTFTCSPEMLKNVRNLADKYRCGIQLHLEEGAYEVEYVKKHFNKLPVEYLRDLGFLKQDVLAAQCVYLNDKEIKILAENDVKIAHNPVSNMAIGAGFAPVAELMNEGATVCLGNDGGLLDMFEIMRIASLVHKGVKRDPSVVTANQALEMATINGAKSLGLQKDIGSLEVGKKADLIVLSPKFSVPINPENVVPYIVNYAVGNDVDMVMVNGNIVVDKKELKTVDEQAVVDETRKAAEALWQRNGALNK